MIDAINRIRGPFNVNAPAIAAGVAAIRDTAHVERSREHNARWLPWLTEEIGKLGLKVTPSVANFVLIHFPDQKATAKEADAFLTKRGLVLRQVGAYKLPHALRMTVGSEEANRLVVKALEDFLGKAGVSKPATLFNRLALIGVGLIGSSIARAARAQNAVRLDRRHRALAAYAPARRRARPRRSGGGDQRRRGRRRRSCHRLHSGRRLRRGRRRRSARILPPAPSSPMSAR